MPSRVNKSRTNGPFFLALSFPTPHFYCPCRRCPEDDPKITSEWGLRDEGEIKQKMPETTTKDWKTKSRHSAQKRTAIGMPGR